jgi:elongation factor 2
VVVSPPIVVYRETIFRPSPVVEGKSPNKHNKLHICVETLEESVYQKMLEGEIPSEMALRAKHRAIFEKIREAGMKWEEAKNVVLIHNKNVIIDLTKGVQFMNEIIEMVKDAFSDLMEEGPLAKEPCTKVKVKIIDAELHEDPVHRGPGQIMPATRYAIRQAMLLAEATLLEPRQTIRVDVPAELIGKVIREVENRRGHILNIQEEKGAGVVTAKLPVSEMFGLDASLKSATSGRAFYSLIETVFERMPQELAEKTIRAIRKRKGLPEEIPKPD